MKSISKWEVGRQRILGPLVIARLRRGGVVLGPEVHFIGRPIIHGAESGSIDIGRGCTLISRSRWTALGVSRPVILRILLPDARITIGCLVGMSGTTICSARSVTIGDRVLFGADVMVTDTDFHPIDEVPRVHSPIPTPARGDEVYIGSDVFVGARSVILKGSRIGAGAVIGAGSVVSGEVLPGAVVGGAPARFIRWIQGEGPTAEGPE